MRVHRGSLEGRGRRQGRAIPRNSLGPAVLGYAAAPCSRVMGQGVGGGVTGGVKEGWA